MNGTAAYKSKNMTNANTSQKINLQLLAHFIFQNTIQSSKKGPHVGSAANPQGEYKSIVLKDNCVIEKLLW